MPAFFKIKAELQQVFSFGKYCGADLLQGVPAPQTSHHLEPSNPATNSTRSRTLFLGLSQSIENFIGNFIASWCYIPVRENRSRQGICRLLTTNFQSCVSTGDIGAEDNSLQGSHPVGLASL